MEDNRREKLIALGAEKLADVLLELAVGSDAVDAAVERLTAPPEEILRGIKRKISGLKRRKRFVDWSKAAGFARELEGLIMDIKAAVTDPVQGVQLVASFYETDDGVMGNCDDSNGSVGDVYQYDAKKLFVEYASACADKEKVADIVLKLNRENDYGVRDILVHCAGEYLPEPVLQRMISYLLAETDKEVDEDGVRGILMLIESLARQVKDPELFEKTRMALRGDLSSGSVLDIARVYFESGDDETALLWVKKLPDELSFQTGDRDRLLLEIYRSRGDTVKMTHLLYRGFRSHRSTDSFAELLEVLGKEKLNEVLADELPLILESLEFRPSDAEFLIAMGKTDEAEEYIVRRADQLKDIFYESLVSLAKKMESEKCFLPASLVYRSLLLSILERGYTKAYHHGVRYLIKLDTFAPAIADWKGQHNHEAFKDEIFQLHGRKWSFWEDYKRKVPLP